MARNTPMMKCGHAANAVNKWQNPCCATCLGIREGADVIDTSPPNLEGRMARCGCGNERPSSSDLPFFEYGRYAAGDPGGPVIKTVFDYDTFYCGCRGWD